MADMLTPVATFAFVFAATYAAFGFGNAYVALLTGSLASTAITFVSLRLRISELRKRETLLLLSALEKLRTGINGNLPFAASLASAVEILPDGSAVKAALDKASRRIELGIEPEGAVADAFAETPLGAAVIAPMLNIAKNYSNGSGIGVVIDGEIDRLESTIEERKEADSGALGRYLVLSMVTSTIIPSLAMFSFVGYSILESASASIGLFAIVILAIIPSSYAAVRAKVADVYAWQI
jgi:Flp pilus assembly protein TadB